MTIKQQGGIFGRNPTFNDLTVEGTLTTTGSTAYTSLDVDNVNIDGNTISTTDTNGNLVLAPDGTGYVQVRNTTLPKLELFNSREWGSGDDGTMSSLTTWSNDASGGGPRAVAEIEVYNNVGSSVPGGEFRFKTSKGGGSPTFLECFRLDNNGDAIFYTNDGVSTITEGAKFDASSGNLVFPSGNGIDFSATADGAGASISELLSEYEQGSWTPNVEGTTTAGAGTYNSFLGKYTRIGNRVMFNCWINMTAHTGSGNMVITGLPFASNSGNNFHNCNVQYSSALTVPSGSFAVGMIFDGSSQIAFYSVPTGTTTATALALDTGFVLNVSGQYEAA